MKKTINNKYFICSLIFSVVSLCLVSCNDFLNVSPPSQVSPEKYLTTADQLKAYLDAYYANYSNWNSYDASTGGMIPSHFGSSNGTPYYDDNATDNSEGTDARYIKDAWTVGQTGGYWNFNNIRALNYFINITKARKSAGLIKGSEADINQYLGEGYFLRALEYFFRLKMLGDFPIITATLPD